MVRLIDRPDMTLDVYRGRKTTIQQQQKQSIQLLTVLRKHLIIDHLKFSLFSFVIFSLLFIGHHTGSKLTGTD